MKHILIIAALIVFLGAGCTNTTPPADNLDAIDEPHGEVTMDSDTMTKEDIGDEPTAEVTGETKSADTATAIDATYRITSGSSSYTVKKEFFGKPKQDITGTTSGINGVVTVANGRVSVNATIENTFSTGNGGRDGDVKKLLKHDIIVAASNITIANATTLDAGNTISETIPLDLTIAGRTTSVPFRITVSPNTNGLSMQGSATFNMKTDFGITPPSILNVYTVNPAMTVSFHLTAKK